MLWQRGLFLGGWAVDFVCGATTHVRAVCGTFDVERDGGVVFQASRKDPPRREVSQTHRKETNMPTRTELSAPCCCVCYQHSLKEEQTIIRAGFSPFAPDAGVELREPTPVAARDSYQEQRRKEQRRVCQWGTIIRRPRQTNNRRHPRRGTRATKRKHKGGMRRGTC